MKPSLLTALLFLLAWSFIQVQAVDSSADDRTPVPEKQLQTKCLAKVKEVFKIEYKDVSPAGRAALARKLLQEADAEDPVTRFVMLQDSRDLAIKAGDLKVAFKSIDALAKSFLVSAAGMKVAVLTTIASAKPAPEWHAFAEKCADVARLETPNEDVEAVVKIAELLESASNVVRDRGFSSLAQFRSDDAKWVKQEYLKVKGDLTRIAKVHDDPQLNSRIGHYDCFVLGDFDRGLPLLAAGGDPDLKEIASADLAATNEEKSALTLGNRWWDLAQVQKNPGKIRILARAGHWYARALPAVSGLEKLGIEKRLNESSPAWLSEMPMREMVTGAWGIGKGTVGGENLTPISVNGDQFPHGLGMHPPSSGASHVTFDVNKQFKHFEAAGAIDDTGDKPTASPLTFRVVGDGHELWRSKPMQTPGSRQSFMVDVANFSKLELFVDCPGYFHGCYAVWLEPRLYPW